MEAPNAFYKALSLIGILFSLYSLFHGFTKTKLTDRHRFILSIGSSCIMIFFAANYTLSMYLHGMINEFQTNWDFIYNMAQWFLLGISMIYMIHNLTMITQFFSKDKSTSWKQYYRNVRNLSQKHKDRYSMHQVKIQYALVFTLLSGLLFYANHSLQIVSSQTVIWIVFASLPFFAFEHEPKKSNRNKHSQQSTNRRRR